MADDPDMLAAEYVLGTLDAAERRAVGRRLLTDAAMVAQVADWQAKLAPLGLIAAEVPPPPGLWQRIEAATVLPRAANDNRSVRWWQTATAAAVLAAVGIAGLAIRPVAPTPAPIVAQAPAPSPLMRSVAALSTQGGSPALLVTYDSAGRMRVLPVNVSAQVGKSLELWMITGKAAPKSIGLMPERGAADIAMQIDQANDMTIAVSLEPAGGSPTGAPTGPVLYSGQMVNVPVS
jgi:anti-sigma-K factor RskA